MRITINQKRRDNKYPVSFFFAGQDNGFGGLTYPKTINKLFSREKVIAELLTVKDTDTVINRSGEKFETGEEA